MAEINPIEKSVKDFIVKELKKNKMSCYNMFIKIEEKFSDIKHIDKYSNKVVDDISHNNSEVSFELYKNENSLEKISQTL